jgi:hypothetical protein
MSTFSKVLNHSLVLVLVSRSLHILVSAFSRVTPHIALSRLHTHPLALSQKTCQRKMDILQPSSPLRRKYIYLVHSLDLSSYLVDIEATSTSFLSSRPERVATSRPLPVPLSLFVTTEGPWTSSLSNPNRGPATYTKGREKGKGQNGARVYDIHTGRHKA